MALDPKLGVQVCHSRTLVSGIQLLHSSLVLQCFASLRTMLGERRSVNGCWRTLFRSTHVLARRSGRGEVSRATVTKGKSNAKVQLQYQSTKWSDKQLYDML